MLRTAPTSMCSRVETVQILLKNINVRHNRRSDV